MTLRIRGQDLVWRTVGDEVIALDLRSSKYLRVNATGALLWQHMQSPAGREALVDALVDRFDLPREQAAGDLDGFLAMLSENELLES
ncbi:MAG: PqqD family protein [Egibacteraceae bacterium]